MLLLYWFFVLLDDVRVHFGGLTKRYSILPVYYCYQGPYFCEVLMVLDCSRLKCSVLFGCLILFRLPDVSVVRGCLVAVSICTSAATIVVCSSDTIGFIVSGWFVVDLVPSVGRCLSVACFEVVFVCQLFYVNFRATIWTTRGRSPRV